MKELKTFEVIDSTVTQVSGSYGLSFDSLADHSPEVDINLVDFLSTRTSLNFKNYGPGMLATPTFRGGDANHTQVLWNGMRINSPMLGTIDFSTLPLRQFNSIRVFSANSSNLYSSGGLGGTVSLVQEPSFTNRFFMGSYTAGSFASSGNMGHINFPFALANRPATIAVYSEQYSSENAFPYTDISTEPYERKIWENASFSRVNTSVALGWQPAQTLQLTAYYWVNKTDRSIPGTINTNSGVAQQNDLAHRGMLHINWVPSAKLNFSIKSMYEDNLNAYADTSINIDNENVYTSSQNQVEVSYKPVNKVDFVARASTSWLSADSKNYDQREEVVTASALSLVRYRFWKNKVEVEGGYRFEQFIDQSGLLPFAGATIKPFLKVPISVLASYAQTVRFPTLNERYWVPGGNLQLKAERGETIETGLRYSSGVKEISLIGFYSVYDNRIRWLPTGSLFAPTNVDYSEVIGLEFNGKYPFKLVEHTFIPMVNGSWMEAQGRSGNAPLRSLSFIPEWSVSARLMWEFKRLSAYYSVNYMGQRFITNDETAYLPYYILQSTGANYRFEPQPGFDWSLSLSVDNIANWQYQNMPWRPMPGRTFNVKIQFQWNG